MLQPVRRIRLTRRSISGVYLFRGETPIEYESALERDFIVRQEFLLSVLDVIPQPCTVEWRHPSGRVYPYTPDFAVYYRLGNLAPENYPRPILVEVKPRAMWKKHWREWAPKWKAAMRYAEAQGMRFRLFDESRIRDGVFANIRFLEPYKRMCFDREESDWVVGIVAEMGMATVDYLLARCFPGFYRAQGLAHLWHLLAIRRLECDISRPLGLFTELWVPYV